jgi:dolichyl-phosphate-mannose--protein O-mannosyl transferase
MMIGGGTLAVYIASFIVHFVITPYEGPGTSFLKEGTAATLLKPTDSLWAIRVRSPHILLRVWDLVLDMHSANMGISEFHQFESRPITWPLLTGAHTAFWTDSNDRRREVNCTGNIYVYVMVLYAILVLTFCSPFNANWANVVILAGYYLHYLPFFLIKRAMFLYHYHIPLFFGCMAVGAVEDLIFSRTLKIPVTAGAIWAALHGFVIWYPFVYGLATDGMRKLYWDDRWMYGDEVHKKLAEIDAQSKNGEGSEEI